MVIIAAASHSNHRATRSPLPRGAPEIARDLAGKLRSVAQARCVPERGGVSVL